MVSKHPFKLQGERRADSLNRHAARDKPAANTCSTGTRETTTGRNPTSVHARASTCVCARPVLLGQREIQDIRGVSGRDGCCRQDRTERGAHPMHCRGWTDAGVCRHVCDSQQRNPTTSRKQFKCEQAMEELDDIRYLERRSISSSKQQYP